MNTSSQNYDIWDQTANWVVKTILCDWYKNIAINIFWDVTANATIKICGSIQEDKPDFDASVSKTNTWDYIQTIDKDSWTEYAGSTWVSTPVDWNIQLIVNSDILKWVWVKVTWYTAWTVSSKVFLTNNV